MTAAAEWKVGLSWFAAGLAAGMLAAAGCWWGLEDGFVADSRAAACDCASRLALWSSMLGEKEREKKRM